VDLQTSEFNRRMKYAFMNEDPYGVLNSIYDNDIPHPYFNPEQVAFSKLRSFDHNKWQEREKSDRTIVFEDLEYVIPGEQFIWEATGTPPCTEKDYLITSSITYKDHNWPCKYAFSSWHLVNTSMSNKDVVLEHNTTRPYFANVLLGNGKPMRSCFFDLLKDNNQLDNNLVNLFKVYKSPFIDEGNSKIDNFFTNITHTEYTNTAINDLDGVPTFTSHYISKHIEDATWISLVAETLDTDRIFFPTEKVGKPMLCNKPFIVLSGKHYLKMLKHIGFKTFHPVIDESYDDIDDTTQRTKSAFESFMQLQKLDPIIVRQELKKVLDYNLNRMRDKLWLTRNARALIDPLTTEI
tara:strand:+ start:6047 stop:7099 length:1053 start_codon:yes stop_codon:yes gene_type:complete